MGACVLVATAVGSASAGVKRICRNVSVPAGTVFADPGLHPVGVSTRTYIDPSRPTSPNTDYPGAPDRTLVTEIWYPAVSAGRDTAVDDTAGPYPIVMHSHGFTSFRTGMGQVASRLASHGYIVASIDYPLTNISAPGGPTVADVHNQPGDMSYVIDQLLTDFSSAADPVEIGSMGLSLGGLTTWIATYHPEFRDPRIRAAIGMAAPACMFKKSFFKTTETPRLVLHGSTDLIVPARENGRRAFKGGKATRHYALLDNASHTGFTAVASAFDQEVHFDAIGCTFLESSGFGDGVDGETNSFEALGGSENGVRSGLRCPSPCADGVPAIPAMTAARHHQLTSEAVVAFFDGYLKNDLAARCHVATTYSDHEEVKVRTKRAR